jgi:glycosyltransferase involved in cell wall biosynthesis
MRILMVTSFVPDPASTVGGALVMHGQLTALAKRHEVVLITFAGTDPTEREAIIGWEAQGVKSVAVARPQTSGLASIPRRCGLAVRWLHGHDPLRTLAFRVPAMQATIDRVAGAQRFDVLQVEDSALGDYRYPPNIPPVLTEHEVRRRDACAPHRSGVRHLLRRAEERRWLSFQERVWRRFGRIQVFTEEDATAVRSIAPDVADRVRVNPFGVDLPTPANADREVANTIVFVGGFLHPPNVDAALWLGTEIMPLLRRESPGVLLSIVGSTPPPAVRRLAREDIIVTGRVPLIDPFLERAAVVLAPVRLGGGMRVKVLQAMAKGKAVVTTPIGTEGLTLEGAGALPLVVAQGSQAIATGTATLLADTGRRRALGARARDFVARHHSWSAYLERLEALYRDLCPNHVRYPRQVHADGRRP